jgi:hypothetical protein
MKQAVKIMSVWIAIFLAGTACFEAGLRYFDPLPVHGGVFRDRGGNIVRVAQDEFTLRPNLDVIHSASEFSVEIHTDALGFRKVENESKMPDYLFLGDSFTFGHGVADADVFSSIFCRKNNFTCLNLGRSGTGTFEQIRILRYATDTLGIKPKNVVVVMLAACSLDVSGNDLKDNLDDRLRHSGNIVVHVAMLDIWGPLKLFQRWVDDLEITKRAMLVVSSGLKRGLYSCSSEASIEAALKVTDIALAELENLSVVFHFGVSIFVIHPYQELDRDFRTTEGYLRKLPPHHFNWFFTGQHFRRQHYYAYDGHFNAAGHANMASVVETALKAR